MYVKINCLRNHGRPIPKHQFAFKQPLPGKLTVHEERDNLLNRHTHVARFYSVEHGKELLPPLREAQLIEITTERLILSGIERIEDMTIKKVEDVAQTWLCWFT